MLFRLAILASVVGSVASLLVARYAVSGLVPPLLVGTAVLAAIASRSARWRGGLGTGAWLALQSGCVATWLGMLLGRASRSVPMNNVAGAPSEVRHFAGFPFAGIRQTTPNDLGDALPFDDGLLAWWSNQAILTAVALLLAFALPRAWRCAVVKPVAVLVVLVAPVVGFWLMSWRD